MGNLGNFIQILVFVLVIAGPTIGAIARKVKAHSDAKKAEAEQNRQRIEAIRTGRTTPTPEPAAGTGAEDSRRARLEELARQRRAQIEELRRRAALRKSQSQGQAQGQTQGQTQRQGQPSAPSRQARPQQTAQRPPVQTRTAPAGPQPIGAPAPAQSRQAIEARRRAEIARRRAEIQAQREQAARAEQAARRARSQTREQAPTPARSSRRVAAEPAQRPVTHVHLHADAPIAATLRDPVGLRNAILLKEILGPPVGLRDPRASDDPLAF